ncbi:helix-turn-helix domain-containing protein [Olivibacter sitiensis]|uniref:helix-turn-helix domain-containing protein n=1 Tax=Olivibacter sitiensis TaxID=376470 RepID=UPI0003FC69CC|nr:helix-turn-helix domain-containing protein [Olivibacter sitiensis]
MPDLQPDTKDFISQITTIVEDNLSNEQFGVSELADASHMSRSNLLRKVKHLTNLSVSQFIRQVRLKHSMDMLRTSSLTVSEIAHQVGFGSTSYFIKCFREYYGYPPGEANKRSETESEVNEVDFARPNRTRRPIILAFVALLILFGIGWMGYYLWPSPEPITLEKSIVVLPFKNDSNDSTNVYLINGLMESTLNNLQKIKDLKVISRTSAEKYRNTAKSIPEMARELNANYFVEGSGQKIGNQILLNIQLIEASSDKHLWTRQYRREVKDIFQLQQEIAKDIASEIQVIVTLDERKQIEKKPTENLVAYDLFLKGLDLLRQGGSENLESAIAYFKKAIEQDNKFALAHACAAIACYYLDIFQTEKKYTSDIASFADKALFHDPVLPESLIAKALFYAHKGEYEAAVPYFEKALEYNPNSILAINFLSDLYNGYLPNTAKYLEYALKGLRLDAKAHDSAAMSLNYLHLSNALIQTGFIEESLDHINKSLDYNPGNSFSIWVKAAILFAKDKRVEQGRQLLLKELDRNPAQLHFLQEVAKTYHYTGDNKEAYRYFKQFIDLREAQQVDVFKNVDLTIAIVMSQMGMKEEAKKFAASFKAYADSDQSIYKEVHLALYHLYLGNNQKSINHLKLFSKEDNFQYWILLLPQDPIMDPIRSNPKFKKVMHTIETKFWDKHKEIRISLEDKGLL